VHRFSVGFQRQQRKKKAFKSSLTEIENVGEVTAKKLLKEFRTIHAISEATIEELCAAGASYKAAEAVFHHYHANP
ncbi:MAG: helix-hairpin-helix domain-containing protein, partial [Pygmaiobacter massiliensis]